MIELVLMNLNRTDSLSLLVDALLSIAGGPVPCPCSRMETEVVAEATPTQDILKGGTVITNITV